MNSQLVPVFDGTISDESTLLCNARDLHAFLNVKRDFSTWIKNRIAGYGFSADADYIIVQNLRSPNLGSSKSRAQVVADYHLTLDTAKELAMVERNDKGRQVRRYFINCERQLRRETMEQTEQPPSYHIDIADALDNAQNIIDYLKMASLYMEEKIDPAMKAMNCGLFYELHSYVNESRFNARFLHARLSRLQLPVAGKLIK